MSRAARPCNRFCSLLLGLALLMPASLPLSAAETVAPPLPRTLIIDTDPGADDVIALLFAMASPKEPEDPGADHRRRQRAAGKDRA